jgi:nicotinate-nucleotide adenylyltransferase
MMRLAVAPYEWISIDENEIQRGGVSYTVDTLRDVAKAYPEKSLYFIIGSDSLHELWTWRNIREIAARVTFITLWREGHQLPFSCSKLDSMLKDTPLRSIELIDAPLPISSTLIRERVAKGQPIQDLVPEAVEQYIKEQALYQEI